MKTLDNLITWGWADHVLEVTPRRRRSRSGSGCR